MDSKIDTVEAKLKAEIGKVDSKIDTVEAKLKAEIGKVENLVKRGAARPIPRSQSWDKSWATGWGMDLWRLQIWPLFL